MLCVSISNTLRPAPLTLKNTIFVSKIAPSLSFATTFCAGARCFAHGTQIPPD